MLDNTASILKNCENQVLSHFIYVAREEVMEFENIGSIKDFSQHSDGQNNLNSKFFIEIYLIFSSHEIVKMGAVMEF